MVALAPKTLSVMVAIFTQFLIDYSLDYVQVLDDRPRLRILLKNLHRLPLPSDIRTFLGIGIVPGFAGVCIFYWPGSAVLCSCVCVLAAISSILGGVLNLRSIEGL